MMLNALETPRRQLAEIDYALLWSVLMLLFTGMVMVYSASIALPDSPKFAAYKPTHFLMRHAFSIALAIPVGLIVFATPMRFWQRWAPMLFLACLVLLVIVLIPGVGKVVYGARRWLSLGFTSLQPSELMKLFVILYVADYTVRKQDYMQQFSKGFLPMGAAVAAVGLLAGDTEPLAFGVLADARVDAGPPRHAPTVRGV